MRKKKLLMVLLILSMAAGGLTACATKETSDKKAENIKTEVSDEESKDSESVESGQTSGNGEMEETVTGPMSEEDMEKYVDVFRTNIGDDNLAEIYTVNDLLAFRELVNSGEMPELNVELMADLNLSSVCSENVGNWEGIQNYSGTFDGKGYTISELYATDTSAEMAGLFWILKKGSTVRNLNVTDVQLKCTKYGGAVAAKSYGTIDNCSANGVITGIDMLVKKDEHGAIGGIVGRVIVITNCRNEVDLEIVCTKDDYWGYAGGIAGYVQDVWQSGLSCEISNCTNYGRIDWAEGYGAGGIAGYADSVWIEDCMNYGEVNAFYVAAGLASYVGNMDMNRCGNMGNITSPGYAAGLVGLCDGEQIKSYIVNSFNKGEIRSTPWPDAGWNENNRKAAAGLVGRIWGMIVNCYNNGNIVSEGSGTNYAVFGLTSDRRPNRSSKIVSSYSNGQLICTGNGTDVCKYGIGSVAVYAIDNVFCLENCEMVFYESTPDSGIEAQCVKTESEFMDGTILNLLQDYEIPEEYLELFDMEVCEWIQGENGPCLDWE